MNPSSPSGVSRQPATAHLAELRDFAQRAYVLLDNLTDDEECQRDHHGNCQMHHLERDCSNERARVLLDQYTPIFDRLFDDLPTGLTTSPASPSPNSGTPRSMLGVGASPSSETATEADEPLRESDAEDFRQRIASLKRCIPHMVDNGGIWPRDVEWLIAELEKSRAALASSPTETPPEPLRIPSTVDVGEAVSRLTWFADWLQQQARVTGDRGGAIANGYRQDAKCFRSLVAALSSPPVPAEAPNEDTALLDFVEAWTKGDTTICPPGYHGGDSTHWLIARQDESKGDSYGQWCVEHEGPTLRDAIRAARSTPTEATNAE